MLGVGVRAVTFARRLYAQANASFIVTPWQRGGLNE
jgi:hypothetical protein